MAQSPLIIQRPQVSLISGNQLPQASGAGVPTPNIAGPLMALGARLQQKADRNKAIDDELAGKRDFATFTGKDANGNYVGVTDLGSKWTPEYRASALNTQEENFRATIRADVNADFSALQADTTLDTEKKIARMQANLQGRIDMLPKEVQAEAYQWGTAEIEQRRNVLANEDMRKYEAAQVEGIKQRITDGSNAAISAAASGADPSPHRLEVFKAYDELVEKGLMTQETADAVKLSTGRFIDATATQKTIAGELLKGNLTPGQVDYFADVLDVGGDEDLASDTLREATPFNLERERDPLASRKLFNTAELREQFQDPATTKAVAAELRQIAASQAARLKDFENDRALFDTIGRLGDNQSLPKPLRDDFNKAFDRWISANRHTTPEGMAQMIEFIRRTKVMPQSMVDTMLNTMRGNDYEAAARMVQVWQMIGTSEDGAADVGAQIRRSMSAADEAELDALAAAARQIGSLGPDAKARGDQWQRYNAKAREPGNTVEAAIKRYNDAKPQNAYGVPKTTFHADLRTRFRGDYGLAVPAAFEKDVERAYHIRLALGDGITEEQALDEAYKTTAKRYTQSKIFAGGFQLGEDLTNPEDYVAYLNTERSAVPGLKIRERKDQYQWVNDYVKDQIMDLNDAGLLALDENERTAVVQILDSDMPRPLGEAIWLEATGTDANSPQYNILIATPDGSRVRLRMKDGNGDKPVVIDPGIVRNHLNSKTQARKEIEELRELGDFQRQSMIHRQYNKAWKPGSGLPKFTLEPMDDQVFRDWFLQQPEDWQKEYLKSSDEIDEALKKGIEKINNAVPTLPKGVDIGPTTYLESRAAGPDVTIAAIKAVDAILPDGSNGNLLLNIAAVESDFGRADGTFRASGDRGIMQINDGDSGAFREIQRRAKIPGNPIAVAAEKLKPLGIDVASLTASDLDKPLVSVALARLYLMTDPAPLPTELPQQASLWKRVYNTVAGAGSEEGFLAKAGKLVMPEAQAAMPRPGMIPGAILDMQGNANPANFLATEGSTQAAALRLSSAFGKELRVTPHGGTQPDSRKPTSQHKHGKALDFYIDDYSDAEKTRLIATAIAMNYRGIGGYAAGDGKGTLHLDRRGGGNGPGGLAVWWRARPGVDGPWDSGPKWFTDGVRQGLAMREAAGG